MDKVKKATHDFQYLQIKTHINGLGHPVKEIPKLRNRRATVTCPACGIGAQITTKTILLPGNKVNHQMKCDGAIMVKTCASKIN